MAANTMATIEPRLMHLLNVNDDGDRDHLPSIHSTLGAPDSSGDAAAFLLPPLELNPAEQSSAAKQHQPHLHLHQPHQQHLQQQQNQLSHHAHAASGRMPPSLTYPPPGGGGSSDDPGMAGPSSSSGGATAGWSSHSLRMLLSDGPGNAADMFGLSSGPDDPSSVASSSTLLIGKRSHVPSHNDEVIHLPQPLKKQKSTPQVGARSQVFPPIINGLHEPPPNAAVFPPIAYAEYDDRAQRHLSGDYASSSVVGGGGGGGSSGNSDGHYLFEGTLSGSGTAVPHDIDRTGEAASPGASMLQTGGRRAPPSNLILGRSSPQRGSAGKQSAVPSGYARSARSATAETAESPEPPPASAGSTKPKRRATKPRRRWTEEETNQLLIGVSRHGLGKWTAILDDPEFTFSNRTAGDLKDRFRTCCPDELRGNFNKNDQTSIAASPPKSASTSASAAAGGARLKSKTSLPLEDILIEPSEHEELHASSNSNQALDRAPGASTSPEPAKSRKRRVHRKNMEDMIKLGIHGPFKKSHRRERRPFTEQDDREILEGLQIYGPAWTKIHRHATFNLSGRQPTDLRDRVRNKYPEIYTNIEKGAYQPQADAP